MGKNKGIKITLTGNPLSTQNIYRFVCRGRFGKLYMLKKGKERKEHYILEVKKQYKRKPIKTDIEMNVVLFFGDKRKRDCDNHLKICQDSLNDLVYVDDSQIQKLIIKKDYDKINPRIEIIIKKI